MSFRGAKIGLNCVDREVDIFSLLYLVDVDVNCRIFSVEKCGPNPRSSILIFKEVETLKPTEPPVHPPVQPSVQPPEATTYGPTCHPTCHTLPYTFSGNRETVKLHFTPQKENSTCMISTF